MRMQLSLYGLGAALAMALPQAWAQDAAPTPATPMIGVRMIPADNMAADTDVVESPLQLVGHKEIVPTGHQYYGPIAGRPGFGLPGCRVVQPYQFFGRVEYLLWDVKDVGLPPLEATIPARFIVTPFRRTIATDGTITDVPLASQNVDALIHISPTVPGAAGLDQTERSGGRVTLGYMIDPLCETTVSFSYFRLENWSVDFAAAGTTPLEVSTNFVNEIVTLQPDGPPTVETDPIEFSMTSDATALGSLKTRFWGAELYGQRRLMRLFGAVIYVGGGLRYVDLNEDLTLSQAVELTVTPNPGALGTVVLETDPTTVVFSEVVSTENRFIGLEVGTTVEYRKCGFFVSGTAKVAVGGNRQEVLLAENATGNLPQGDGAVIALVLPQNIGEHSRTRLSAVPELTALIGYEFGPQFRAFVGVNLIYLTNAVRPGNVFTSTGVSTNVMFRDAEASASQTRSSFLWGDEDFWARGLLVGGEFRY